MPVGKRGAVHVAHGHIQRGILAQELGGILSKLLSKTFYYVDNNTYITNTIFSLLFPHDIHTLFPSHVTSATIQEFRPHFPATLLAARLQYQHLLPCSLYPRCRCNTLPRFRARITRSASCDICTRFPGAHYPRCPL